MLFNIINDKDSYDFSEFPTLKKVLDGLGQEKINELSKILQQMKKETLYKGLVHGQYHSEKVLMFTYLLANELNLEEPYRTILFDAALYHDTGRTDNSENSMHGLASADNIEKIVGDNPLYQDKYYLLLLKAIIDAHSRIDKQETASFVDFADKLDLLDEKFELTPALENYLVYYYKLARLLKDADALDRKRFGDAGFESLNPRYLRFDEAKQLVQFAEELNAFYYELMKINYPEVNEDNIKGAPCVHSVGFDFFKINSVLKHGILSQEEMKKRQLKVPRNFAGGNFDRWISVVDIELLKRHATAAREFIERGVTFVCENVKMHEPSPAYSREEAIVTGMPWNKSNHEDERYVKNRIAPEKFIAINIPFNYVHKSILDTAKPSDKKGAGVYRMIYIYNSLDIKMIKQRVLYYKEKTQTPDDSPYWLIIKEQLYAYERVLIERDLYGRDGIAEQLTPILDIINSNIGKMIYSYYYPLIGSGGGDITVSDVVEYELSKNYNLRYNACNTPDGLTFFLEPITNTIGQKQL